MKIITENHDIFTVNSENTQQYKYKLKLYAKIKSYAELL